MLFHPVELVTYALIVFLCGVLLGRRTKRLSKNEMLDALANIEVKSLQRTQAEAALKAEVARRVSAKLYPADSGEELRQAFGAKYFQYVQVGKPTNVITPSQINQTAPQAQKANP